ncbi:uncharacterized protein LOC128323459 isoform X2 [Hemicordylus capensis]|uniref:uncharacterized protein LOC128323459 isoform X2 n=1 Tax=Hemicordylus capensis TaxID=884348 RepID=UPI002302B8AA|nr:uncharacterized protein LOC128323459 isoform X2 [Hemicordylus capensis]
MKLLHCSAAWAAACLGFGPGLAPLEVVGWKRWRGMRAHLALLFLLIQRILDWRFLALLFRWSLCPRLQCCQGLRIRRHLLHRAILHALRCHPSQQQPETIFACSIPPCH